MSFKRSVKENDWELHFHYKKDALLSEEHKEQIDQIMSFFGVVIQMGVKLKTPILRSTFFAATLKAMMNHSYELNGAHEILLQQDIFNQDLEGDLSTDSIFGSGIDED